MKKDKIIDLAKQMAGMIDQLHDIDTKTEVLNEVRKELHKVSPYKDHPVDLVEWVKSEDVEKNDYNPNAMFPPEFKLLIQSILSDGFTQPVVTNPEADIRRIVDGFHRRKVIVTTKKISESTYGRIPVTSIRKNRSSFADRIASTIRHNRARGVHAIDEMVHIVSVLKQECEMSDDWIMKNIGMDADELLRLKQVSGIIELFKDKEFSRSWE
jgi:ParB-like chromosome segregation protein Spo0J